MNKINPRYQILNFILLVVFQILLVNRASLFNVAFGFFYIGFILLLPANFQKGYLMIVAFFVGLFVDIFSNTPGLNAGASVLIAFLRNISLEYFMDANQEQNTVSYKTMGLVRFVLYLLSFILVHHLFLFIFENEGLRYFGQLLARVFASTLLTFSVILSINLLIAPKVKRL